MLFGFKQSLIPTLVMVFVLFSGFGINASAFTPIEGLRRCKALLTQSKARTPVLRERFNSLSEAREVFNAIVASNDIPFDYKVGGCEARAHALALKLEQMGYYSQKIMMEGILPMPDPKYHTLIRFGDHVAVAIRIAHIHYVFDPTFFSGPVSVREWLAKFTNKPTHLVTLAQRLEIPEPENLEEPIYFFAERFYLTPSNTVRVIKKWSRGDAEYVERSLQRQWYSLDDESKN